MEMRQSAVSSPPESPDVEVFDEATAAFHSQHGLVLHHQTETLHSLFVFQEVAGVRRKTNHQLTLVFTNTKPSISTLTTSDKSQYCI